MWLLEHVHLSMWLVLYLCWTVMLQRQCLVLCWKNSWADRAGGANQVQAWRVKRAVKCLPQISRPVGQGPWSPCSISLCHFYYAILTEIRVLVLSRGQVGPCVDPPYPQLMKRKHLSILVSPDVGMTPSQSFCFTISKVFSKSCPRTTDQNPRRAFKKVQMTGLIPRDAEFVGLRWDRWACNCDKKPLTRFLMHTNFWVLLLLEGLLNPDLYDTENIAFLW